MRKLFKYILLLLVITIIGLIVFYVYPRSPILSGYGARMMCTCHFVQGRSQQDILHTDLAFNLFPKVSYDIDEKGKRVKSSFLGMSPKIAEYRENMGCILLKGKDDHHVKMPTISRIVDDYSWKTNDILTKEQKEIIDTLTFGQNEKNPYQTRALIIIKNDSIIYEKYGAGMTVNTPLLGWSMTKSVTSTLIGLMIQDGFIPNTKIKNLRKRWTDERSNITLEDLLQMRSGLAWDEDYGKVSSATTMLFDSEDVVAVSDDLGLEGTLGQHWEYSSGTTNLLCGVMRDHFESKEEYLKYPFERLFRPLGMKSAFIELDESGHFIGSSYMYATARDWAKYGLLYLHQGYWEGEQILDSKWVQRTFESEPTSNGKYGMQFWHNKKGVELPDAPHDMIFADGYQGQRVFILPSQNMVIVRLGLENLDFNKLVGTIVN